MTVQPVAPTKRTLGAKLGEAPSLLDYGAKCDGSTDDTAAITTAMASGKRISIPAGMVCVSKSISQAGITGVLVGPGQVKTSDGTLRGPLVSQVSAPPASTAPANVVQGFSGDLSHVLLPMEHRVGGNALTANANTAAYVFENELAATYLSDFFSSGSNTSSGNSPNVYRTGYGANVVDMTHLGHGDAAMWFGSGFCQGPTYGSLPEGSTQTSFLAGPACEILSGVLQAGAPGVYLQGIGDVNLQDMGFDIGAIGSTINLDRTNATGATGGTWIGYRVQSGPSAASDAAFSASGSYKMVVDAVDATGSPVVASSAGQRYYGNATQTATDGTLFPSKVNLGTEWLVYNATTAGWELVVGSNVVARFTAGGMQTPVTTVAKLATCNAAAEGTRSAVSDAAAPSFLGPLTGGGSIHSPAYCNGTAWVAG